MHDRRSAAGTFAAFITVAFFLPLPSLERSCLDNLLLLACAGKMQVLDAALTAGVPREMLDKGWEKKAPEKGCTMTQAAASCWFEEQ